MEQFQKRLTIGQMAKLNHISTQTLRYYDRIGLLKPSELDDKNGYRYYDITQCAVLDTITHLKALNLPLQQIKSYLETNDSASFIEKLKSRKKKVDAELAGLQNTKAIIERMLMDDQQHALLPRAGTPYLEYIPQRPIYKFDTGINYYDNEDAAGVYEYMLRLFKNNIFENHLPPAYFYNVGGIMGKDRLLQRNFVTTELFVFLEPGSMYEPCAKIPANSFLCMVCDNSNLETRYIDILLNEIAKNNYTVVGDYICEVVSEFFSAKDNQRNMTLKLQIPIAFQ